MGDALGVPDRALMTMDRSCSCVLKSATKMGFNTAHLAWFYMRAIPSSRNTLAVALRTVAVLPAPCS